MQLFEILLIIFVVILLFGAGGLLFLKNTRTKEHKSYDDLRARVDQFERNLARTEAILRDELARSREETSKSARENRQELAGSFKNLQDSLVKSMGEMSALQKAQLESFATQLGTLTQSNEARLDKLIATLNEQLQQFQQQTAGADKENREALAAALKSFGEQFSENVKNFTEQQREKLDRMTERQAELNTTTETRLEKMRETIEGKLLQLQEENARKLEEMRATVDEKLQKTLETRLGQSFELVGKQLENVQKGLGEMQTLAQDVGGLKKVLSNVKMRGGIGEVQLEMLLEQILAPDQYERNVRIKAHTSESVEFAIRLPGRDDQHSTVYLPIDAKFPKDVYEQYILAHEGGDLQAIERASKELENRLKSMAKDIHDKYLQPPDTTDFAILFLPFESIYAEVVRRSHLIEQLQRDYKIVVTGPTTLAVILNSLQMGFRTLAIQQRSSEVWKILGAVKTEFEKFGGMLEKAQKNLHTATNQLDEVIGKRTRAIQRKLKGVEALPASESQQLLPESGELWDDETAEEAADA